MAYHAPYLVTSPAPAGPAVHRPSQLSEDIEMGYDPMYLEQDDPSLVALDTNVLIRHLPLIRTLADLLEELEPRPLVIFVPGVVVNELDGLTRRIEEVTPGLTVGELARAATSWLLDVNRRRRETGRGVVKCQRWAEHLEERKKPDDRILDACLYLLSPQRTSSAPASRVTLWTNDQNLQLLAESNDIPTIGGRFLRLEEIWRQCVGDLHEEVRQRIWELAGRYGQSGLPSQPDNGAGTALDEDGEIDAMQLDPDFLIHPHAPPSPQETSYDTDIRLSPARPQAIFPPTPGSSTSSRMSLSPSHPGSSSRQSSPTKTSSSRRSTPTKPSSTPIAPRRPSPTKQPHPFFTELLLPPPATTASPSPVIFDSPARLTTPTSTSTRVLPPDLIAEIASTFASLIPPVDTLTPFTPRFNTTANTTPSATIILQHLLDKLTTLELATPARQVDDRRIAFLRSISAIRTILAFISPTHDRRRRSGEVADSLDVLVEMMPLFLELGEVELGKLTSLARSIRDLP